MTLADMPTNGLLRLRRKVVNRIYDLFRGGTQYGVDVPTLRIVYPEWYRLYCQIADEEDKRKGNKR